MSLKYIFWDNDGVLVDTESLYYEANRKAVSRLGIELSEEMFRKYWLSQSQGLKLLLKVEGLQLSSTEFDELQQERNMFYSTLLQRESRLIDGVSEVLLELSSVLRMGIVTSSRRDHFELIHQKTGILHYFDFVLANGDYLRGKPAPDPYLKALDVTGIAKEECLVIEDSQRGLAAAKAAGICCWVIPFGISSCGDFSRADRILNSIQDLPDAVSVKMS